MTRLERSQGIKLASVFVLLCNYKEHRCDPEYEIRKYLKREGSSFFHFFHRWPVSSGFESAITMLLFCFPLVRSRMLKACVAVVVVEFCEAETVDVPAVATFCETEIIGDPATFWEFQTAGVSSSWSDVIDLVTK